MDGREVGLWHWMGWGGMKWSDLRTYLWIIRSVHLYLYLYLYPSLPPTCGWRAGKGRERLRIPDTIIKPGFTCRSYRHVPVSWAFQLWRWSTHCLFSAFLYIPFQWRFTLPTVLSLTCSKSNSVRLSFLSCCTLLHFRGASQCIAYLNPLPPLFPFCLARSSFIYSTGTVSNILPPSPPPPPRAGGAAFPKIRRSSRPYL